MNRKEFVKTTLVAAAAAAAALPEKLSAQPNQNPTTMKTSERDARYAGLESMLTPDNCVLILIDHQPFQFTNLRNMDPQLVINNTVALAKSAKIFDVPTIFTTVVEKQGGLLLKQLQDVFPDQK